MSCRITCTPQTWERIAASPPRKVLRTLLSADGMMAIPGRDSKVRLTFRPRCKKFPRLYKLHRGACICCLKEYRQPISEKTWLRLEAKAKDTQPIVKQMKFHLCIVGKSWKAKHRAGTVVKRSIWFLNDQAAHLGNNSRGQGKAGVGGGVVFTLSDWISHPVSTCGQDAPSTECVHGEAPALTPLLRGLAELKP